jgi:hypothetical protein
MAEVCRAQRTEVSAAYRHVVTSELPDRPPARDDLIKVWFRFVPRPDWFTMDSEGLWAEPVGPDTARVRNVPFLQDGVAEGDIVRFMTNDDGVNWVVERVQASGNCTIRVLPDPSGPLRLSARAVHDRFTQFGMGSESWSESFPFVAFNVPAGADFSAIKALLKSGEDAGWWSCEEGCVSDAWRDA